MGVPPTPPVIPRAQLGAIDYKSDNTGTTISTTVTWGGEEYDIKWTTQKKLTEGAATQELMARVDQFYLLHERFMDARVEKIVWKPEENSVTRHFEKTYDKGDFKEISHTTELSDWNFYEQDPNAAASNAKRKTLQSTQKLDKLNREYTAAMLRQQALERDLHNFRPTSAANAEREKKPLEDELKTCKERIVKISNRIENTEKRVERMKKAQELSTLFFTTHPRPGTKPAQPRAATGFPLQGEEEERKTRWDRLRRFQGPGEEP